MGKFFKDKIKKDRTSLIKYGLIGFGILIILILFIMIIAKNAKPKPIIDVKENITFEVNGKKPKKSDFVKCENYDINDIKIEYNDFDITKVGSYNITIIAPNIAQETITVYVKDTTGPELTVKDVTIPVDGSYEPKDFVDVCSDNSNEECIINFYNESKNESGDYIDYSSFSEAGVYTVKIIASDPYDNESEPKEAVLTIGENQGPGTESTCQYGDLTVTESRFNYPLAVNVGDKTTGCALNIDLWDDDETQKPVNDFYKANFTKLQGEMYDELVAHFPKGNATVTAYPHYIAILNDSLTGLVGYAVYVKVYVHENDITIANNSAYDDYLVATYYLKPDGSRIYEINKYNLK